jgi:hypothetical protein
VAHCLKYEVMQIESGLVGVTASQEIDLVVGQGNTKATCDDVFCGRWCATAPSENRLAAPALKAPMRVRTEQLLDSHPISGREQSMSHSCSNSLISG